MGDVDQGVIAFVPVVLAITLAVLAYLKRRTYPRSTLSLGVALITLPSGLAFCILAPWNFAARPWVGVLCLLPCAAAITLLVKMWAYEFSVRRAFCVALVVVVCSVLACVDLRFSVFVRESQGNRVTNFPIRLEHQNWAQGYQSVEVRTNSLGWAYVGFIRWSANRYKWRIYLPDPKVFQARALTNPPTWPVNIVLDRTIPVANDARQAVSEK